MSRGRHARPEPPHPPRLLPVAAVAVAVGVIVAVWVVDDGALLRVAATGVMVLLAVVVLTSVRASSAHADRLWRESLLLHGELRAGRDELGQLRAQHVEVLLELRALRAEIAGAAIDAERRALVRDDQQALMHQLLQPRPAAPDPVYPSLQLPLVRAAFSAEVSDPHPVPGASAARIEREESSGREPLPPRELLDLTASEIARLRPAN